MFHVYARILNSAAMFSVLQTANKKNMCLLYCSYDDDCTAIIS